MDGSDGRPSSVLFSVFAVAAIICLCRRASALFIALSKQPPRCRTTLTAGKLLARSKVSALQLQLCIVLASILNHADAVHGVT
jgi:hypothetical protein